MRRLSLKRLAWDHVQARGGRSALLMVLIGLLSAALLVGAVLSFALQNGLNALADRLGADLIIVPAGYDSKVSGALLRGEPAKFYMEETVLERLEKLDVIEKASPQLFIATLSASCCSAPLQIIGYDAERDFSVGSWINKSIGKAPGEGEIVVGASIFGDVGSELRFFNKDYKIIARLEKTGMGFDNSVFMNMEQARKILEHDAMKDYHEAVSLERPISTVLVRMKDGVDVRDAIVAINQHFRGEEVYALNTENMMRELAGTMRSLNIVLSIVVVLFWLLSGLALLLVFSTILRERQREFRIYRTLGAKVRDLQKLLFYEALYISAIGAFGGVVLGTLVSLFFVKLLILMLGLPYLIPGLPMLVLIAIGSFLVALLTGPLASAKYVRGLRNFSVDDNLREED